MKRFLFTLVLCVALCLNFTQSAKAGFFSGALASNAALTIGYLPKATSSGAGLADSPIYTDGVSVGIRTTGPLAPLQVGNGTVNNSSDSQILISRLVDNTGSGNGHAFSDSSNISRSGGNSYNSFDGRVTLTGTANFGHYASMQSGPTYSSSGTMDNIYNFFSAPTITAGTVTNNYGLYTGNPSVTGGTLVNNYGIYIPLQTSGTTLNYNLYSAGTTASNYIQGNLNTKNVFVTGSATGVADKQIHVLANDGTAPTIRLQQIGENYWDLKGDASATSFSISDVSGTYLTIKNGGNVGIGTVTAMTGALLTVNGAIGTSAPNGGTAKPWKFGNIITGQVGLSLNATQYIELDVNGVLYHLATF